MSGISPRSYHSRPDDIPRSSASSSPPRSDSSSSSNASFLPLYTDEKKRKPSLTQRTSSRLLQTIGSSRRRSSVPLLGLARRKTTQLALAAGLLFLGGLLLGEYREHNLRESLWHQELALQEWDVRHNNARDVSLVTLRSELEAKRRTEELESKLRGPKEDRAWTEWDDVRIRQESEDAWPSWWGNPDLVGQSPFDHRPAALRPGKEKRRFMVLTDYKDYLERMNTHTYEIVDAALRHPGLIVDVWGPGWAGYDRSIPLSANIRKRSHRISQLEKSKEAFEKKRRNIRSKGKQVVEESEIWVKPEWLSTVPYECSDVRFDVVLTISNIFKENDPHLDVLDCGTLLVQQLGDCHELRCSYEWYPQANNITLSKYAFELPELFEYSKVKAKYPDWEMGLFGHSPDTANEWDFWPVKWNEKKADAKIFGYDGSFYPIRTTVTNNIRDLEGSDQKPLVGRHPHPGYTVSVPQQARDDPLETYEKDHQYYTTHLKLRRDFAKGMRESRVCVFDSSLERKLIRKYAQAFLSGCVVASDLPTEQEAALSKFVIPLKSSWNIEQINSAIQYYLDRPEVLQQMAVDALVYARQHLTTTTKVDHILEMADHYRGGSRGYEFPYGFSMRCRAYWSNDDSYRPPWCRDMKSHTGLE
ncbi:hypothetical protein L202_04199 [Cryptococcus amylolentus CBS 6039]|uniref:Uncharacterized protein n=1 Tax=Cryptococcus amylolentus CBS 6039 TaxID=1295533 RepID=A0A1E3HQK0_9TREE|nr:hypothetical protein L202_04199 [Cryptococcus amylolentus CBS 6039]ODN78592.1 hypothetical protein L202_04199 [Cryptococcus amylolentus CBS 6039]